MRPETHYAKSGDLSIAYQVFGDGPRDLVLIHGFVSHIEVAWEQPQLAQFMDRLGAFARVIMFDKRGTGLSDPVVDPPTFPQRADDIRAVMDAAGSRRAALFGISEGGPMSVYFASTDPERATALVLYGSYARWRSADDYAWGRSEEQKAAFLEGIARAWETGEWFAQHNPSTATDERYRSWWARYLRMAASPGMATGLVRMNSEIDIRDLLPRVSHPTLVLHRTNERWFDVRNARYLAEHIPGAKLVELDGVDHVPWLGDAEAVLKEIELFIAGRISRRRGRAFASGASALTRREREIVRLAVAGESAAAMAKRLVISERTVESHLASAYSKLGVESRFELVRRADELGL